VCVYTCLSHDILTVNSSWKCL